MARGGGRRYPGGGSLLIRCLPPKLPEFYSTHKHSAPPSRASKQLTSDTLIESSAPDIEDTTVRDRRLHPKRSQHQGRRGRTVHRLGERIDKQSTHLTGEKTGLWRTAVRSVGVVAAAQHIFGRAKFIRNMSEKRRNTPSTTLLSKYWGNTNGWPPHSINTHHGRCRYPPPYHKKRHKLILTS